MFICYIAYVRHPVHSAPVGVLLCVIHASKTCWYFNSVSIIVITTLRCDLIKTVLLDGSGIYRYRTSFLQRMPHTSDLALQPAYSFSINHHGFH